MDVAPAGKKRRHAASKQPTQKRRKVKSGLQSPPATAAKRAVDVDSLPWRSVAVPEMFGDAEGFYGLEEVDDVEIVREGDKIQFVSLCPVNPTLFSRLLVPSR